MATVQIISINENYYTLEVSVGDAVFTQTIITQETGEALDALIAAYAAEYEVALAELMQG